MKLKHSVWGEKGIPLEYEDMGHGTQGPRRGLGQRKKVRGRGETACARRPGQWKYGGFWLSWPYPEHPPGYSSLSGYTRPSSQLVPPMRSGKGWGDTSASQAGTEHMACGSHRRPPQGSIHSPHSLGVNRGRKPRTAPKLPMRESSMPALLGGRAWRQQDFHREEQGGGGRVAGTVCSSKAPLGPATLPTPGCLPLPHLSPLLAAPEPPRRRQTGPPGPPHTEALSAQSGSTSGSPGCPSGRTAAPPWPTLQGQGGSEQGGECAGFLGLQASSAPRTSLPLYSGLLGLITPVAHITAGPPQADARSAP